MQNYDMCLQHKLKHQYSSYTFWFQLFFKKRVIAISNLLQHSTNIWKYFATNKKLIKKSIATKETSDHHLWCSDFDRRRINARYFDIRRRNGNRSDFIGCTWRSTGICRESRSLTVSLDAKLEKRPSFNFLQQPILIIAKLWKFVAFNFHNKIVISYINSDSNYLIEQETKDLSKPHLIFD